MTGSEVAGLATHIGAGTMGSDANGAAASPPHEAIAATAAAAANVIELATAMNSATSPPPPAPHSNANSIHSNPTPQLLQDAYLQQHHQQSQHYLHPPHLNTRRFSAGKGKTGRQSSKFGTVNYSIDEMRRLNEKVRAVMPIAGEDWLHVAYQFNYMRPESIPYREVESLKRKFKKMYCSRSSSVSGKLPEYIEEAKELRRLINQRSEKAQLENSDTHSDLDAQEIASGLEHHQQPQQHSGKVDSFAGNMLDASQAAAGRSNNSSSNSSSANGQHPPSHVTEPSEIPGTGVEAAAENVAAEAKNVVGPLVDQQELPQEAQQGASHQHVELQSAEQYGAGEIEHPRDVAGKLSQMEEEYHQAMAGGRASRDSVDGVAGTASSQQHPQQFGDTTTSSSSTSTSGIISMLKHSIERKRRTMEEQMLSESERVRKERKKRKMEQVLYSIHQEQRERELIGAAGLETTAAAILGVPQSPNLLGQAVHGSPAHSGATLPTSSYSSILPPPPSLLQPPTTNETSLGMMEVMLQYMVAQQTENTRRLQLEQERRQRELQEKEARRREKERQRRHEKREFMLVMAAILEDKFPDSLKHHLEEERQSLDDEYAAETSGNAGNDSEPDAAARDNSSSTGVSEGFGRSENEDPAAKTRSHQRLAHDGENVATLI